jgi:hypothetical protein
MERSGMQFWCSAMFGESEIKLQQIIYNTHPRIHPLVSLLV